MAQIAMRLRNAVHLMVVYRGIIIHSSEQTGTMTHINIIHVVIWLKIKRQRVGNPVIHPLVRRYGWHMLTGQNGQMIS